MSQNAESIGMIFIIKQMQQLASPMKCHSCMWWYYRVYNWLYLPTRIGCFEDCSIIL